MLAVHTKGAPESILPSCAAAMDVDGGKSRLDDALRATVQQVLDEYAAQGLRVLAGARRQLPATADVLAERATEEAGLTLIGLGDAASPGSEVHPGRAVGPP